MYIDDFNLTSVIFEKTSHKVNNQPKGEKSSNLVTLPQFLDFICVVFAEDKGRITTSHEYKKEKDFVCFLAHIHRYVFFHVATLHTGSQHRHVHDFVHKVGM
jgi:hypothetical protein